MPAQMATPPAWCDDPQSALFWQLISLTPLLRRDLQASLVTNHDNQPLQQDPYYTREAKKYPDPIPSREFILSILQHQHRPLSLRELTERLPVTPAQHDALSHRIKAMVRDGQLLRNRRGGLCVVNQQDLMTGRIIGHPDGFGFFQPDQAGDDLFLSPREMRKVWHGDRAVAQVSGMDRRGRLEGAIVEVLERSVHQLVGRLRTERGITTLYPDNKRIAHTVLIPPDQLSNARDGQIVVADILEHPARRSQPLGRVSAILGDSGTPGMQTEIAIQSHQLPTNWPDAVTDEAIGLKTRVPTSARAGRTDLRSQPFVTIDGEDARDFDDAVHCRATAKGWHLLVAIADVSAYVTPGSALDREAYERSTSVYFPDRVLPMLPEVLSNELCSLNPHTDRLCLVAELYINHQGDLYRSRFFEAVIHSHARLTYEQAQQLLLGKTPELCDHHADLLPALHTLHELHQVLQKASTARGAIAFETTEARFQFDTDGNITAIEPLVRHDTHRMIEQCMLIANVAAARFLLRHKHPALYRVHERPSATKVRELNRTLRESGLHLTGGTEPTTQDYADLLAQARGRPDFAMIQGLLLRSMQQAVYSADNKGHFGLALPAYTHFTSPIRRYPDLLIHRAIKQCLAQPTDHAVCPTEISRSIAVTGEHCSAQERRADEASRDATNALKCEFMQDKIGTHYSGTITGVHNYGVFVELDGLTISGLVHITALEKDYFHYDPTRHQLSGERSGKCYRLGDPIQVQLVAADPAERRIDFAITQARPKTRKRTRH